MSENNQEQTQELNDNQLNQLIVDNENQEQKEAIQVQNDQKQIQETTNDPKNTQVDAQNSSQNNSIQQDDQNIFNQQNDKQDQMKQQQSEQENKSQKSDKILSDNENKSQKSKQIIIDNKSQKSDKILADDDNKPLQNQSDNKLSQSNEFSILSDNKNKTENKSQKSDQIIVDNEESKTDNKSQKSQQNRIISDIDSKSQKNSTKNQDQISVNIQNQVLLQNKKEKQNNEQISNKILNDSNEDIQEDQDLDHEVFLKQDEFQIDASVIQKQEQDTLMESMDDPLKINLKIALQQTQIRYQKLLDINGKPQDQKVIKDMIKVLEQQLWKLDNNQQVLNQSKNEKPVKKSKPAIIDKKAFELKCYQEIYSFYCKQAHVNGQVFTFDKRMQDLSVMRMGIFMVFANQFNLLSKKKGDGIYKTDMIELIKEVSPVNKEITIDLFYLLMDKIAEIKFKNQFNTHEEKIQALNSFLGIDKEKSFRQKMQQVYLPFTSNINSNDILHHERVNIINKIKIANPLEKNIINPEYIQKKKLDQQLSRKYELEQYRNKSSFENINISEIKRNIPVRQLGNMINDSYIDGQIKLHQSRKGNIKHKITWKYLENIDYKELDILGDDEFKPTDLFKMQNGKDDEDYEYLKEYKKDLIHRKEQEVQTNYDKRQQIEDYGKIKQTLRPTQKFLINEYKRYEQELLQQYAQKSKSVNQLIPHENQKDSYKKQLNQRAKQIEEEQQKYDQILKLKYRHIGQLKQQTSYQNLNIKINPKRSTHL